MTKENGKKISFALRMLIVAAIVVAAGLAVLFNASNLAYAFGINNNQNYLEGNRSPEGVDLTDESIFICYLDALGAGEQGYIFGVEEEATVADLLAYVGLEYDSTTDNLSHGLSTPLTSELKVLFTRTEYLTVTEKEIIPFPTKEIEIVYSAFSKNYKDVAGVDGEREVTYAVKTVNGQVAEKYMISSVVTVEPVTEVRHIDMRHLLDLGNGAPTEYEEELRIKFTAYNYGEVGGAITATGDPTQVGYVAVDPTLIPYHSLLYIVLDNGFVYGYCYAKDCGGGIKGYRIDIFLPTYEDMSDFGIKMGTCYIVRRGK